MPESAVDTDQDGGNTQGLISRSEALAQAVSLDAPEADEEVSFNFAEHIQSSINSPLETSEDQSHHSGALHLPGDQEQSTNESREFPPSANFSTSVDLGPYSDSSGQDTTTEHSDTQVQAATGSKRQRSDSSTYGMRTYNRGRTYWTDEESDCLVKGVTIYGTGRWKDILEHPQLHFQEGRTPADLKDR